MRKALSLAFAALLAGVGLRLGLGEEAMIKPSLEQLSRGRRASCSVRSATK
jgi:hypothetical protein